MPKAGPTPQISVQSDRKELLWRAIKLALGNIHPFYGIGGLICLYLLLIALMVVMSQIHGSIWPGSYDKYWYYDPPLAFVPVIAIVFYCNSKLLSLSAWEFKVTSIATGILVGSGCASLAWGITHIGVASVGRRSMQSTAFIPVVCLAQLLEELLFRGVFLKSLRTRMPPIWALLLVAILAALGEHTFWVALPLQIVLSGLYLVFGDSIPVSAAAHVANNAIVFFLAK